MMASLVHLCGRKHSESGYLLIEMLLALAAASCLAVIVAQSARFAVLNAEHIMAQDRLLGAGNYLLNGMERTIAYESDKVIIKNNSDIVCNTIYGTRKITFIYDIQKNGTVKGAKRVYKRTTTNDGTGINPLHLDSLDIQNWLVQKLDNKKLTITFTLVEGKQKRSFFRTIDCLNGQVEQDG